MKGGAAVAWTVYILRCGDGTLYTGCTNDLPRRLEAHRSGRGAKYTRSRPPVALAYREEAPDRSAALRREAAIKRLSRREKLALLEGKEMRADGDSPAAGLG
jgi:predicted GIY-YIG superfamily endonuclease